MVDPIPDFFPVTPASKPGEAPSEAVNPVIGKRKKEIEHDPATPPDSLFVDRITAITRDSPKQEYQQPKEKKKAPDDEAGKHFESLAKAAEQAHKILVEKKSPYRFCILQKEDKVFIDLILVGPDGKMKEEVIKDITHEEFSNWIRHIHSQEGLFLDLEA